MSFIVIIFIYLLLLSFGINGCSSLVLLFSFLILLAAAWKATQRLLAVSHVINQAIGDALSVLLLVEAVLQYLGWSIEDWDCVYKDLPSKQLKVKYTPGEDSYTNMHIKYSFIICVILFYVHLLSYLVDKIYPR